MKIADLYIRVSTDEQADKGYSQRSQEELLRKYCGLHLITIRKVILEDHSAKTFNRPEWKKYLVDLHKHKFKTDLVLFLKWDRFSRNAGDAYMMINKLRKYGVEPQAIEQPLDLTVPENKMMLAFYLAAPEVENDRRALNVLHGMRRARKEGRYMGLAPIGFLNKTDELGRKTIIPNEALAKLIRWSFEKIAEGVFNTEQIYKLAKEKGFPRSKAVFWSIIRNPVYCGKIEIKKYKDEDATLVKGQHEPIISEALFNDVQDILNGRKRGEYRLKVAADQSLPLRGFLICPKCQKTLTGSSSKGYSKYYAYYHCFDGCKCRFSAEMVNAALSNELSRYIPRDEYLDLYKQVITEAWNNQTSESNDEQRQVKGQINELERKIAHIRDLLASNRLDPIDYKEMKMEYQSKIDKLETKLAANRENKIDLNYLLDTGINNLLKLNVVYDAADSEKKREIIAAMFPEKLTYDGSVLRTARVNDAARFIYMINNDIGTKKNETKKKKSSLSREVGAARFECIPISSIH